MNADPILLQMKYAAVVEQFAERESISLDEALRFFYQSVTYYLMSNGISDMHCMSDGYLAEDLSIELTKMKGEGEMK